MKIAIMELEDRIKEIPEEADVYDFINSEEDFLFSLRDLVKHYDKVIVIARDMAIECRETRL